MGFSLSGDGKGGRQGEKKRGRLKAFPSLKSR